MIFPPRTSASSAVNGYAAAFILLLAFAFQGTRGLWVPDETRYAAGASEMLQSGDYLVARINHEPYLNKPAVVFWGIAAGIKLLGHNEWGVRLFNALYFVVTACAVGTLARLWWGFSAGVCAAMLYAALPAAMGAANVVTPDTPLTMWTALTFLCFWKSLPEQSRPGPWQMLLGLALAGGAMTKGPAALIPAGALFVYLLVRGQVLRFFLTPWMLAGAAAFLVPVAAWYVAVAHNLPGAAHYMWESQIWGRLVTAQYGRNPELKYALFIYGPMLAAGTLPWSVFALVALVRTKPRCFAPDWWANLRRRPVALLLLLWIMLPLTVLSLASSKLPLYILPVFPAIALLCTGSLKYLAQSAQGCTTDTATPHPVARSAHVGPLPQGERAGGPADGTGQTPVLLSPRIWSVFAACGVVLLVLKAFFAYHPSDRDTRAKWEALKPNLPSGHFRLVTMDGIDGKGLEFYRRSGVVEVKWVPDPSDVIFDQTPAVEIAAAKHSVVPRVIVCKTSSVVPHPQVTVKTPKQLLDESGIRYKQEDLPCGWTILTCQPGHDDQPVARVALIGDPGSGGLAGYNAANTLERLREDVNLDGVVFLNRKLNLTPSVAGGAWKPYWEILSDPPRFYTFTGPAFDWFSGPPSRRRGLVKSGYTCAACGDKLTSFFVARGDLSGDERLAALVAALNETTTQQKTIVFERFPDNPAWLQALAQAGVTDVFSTEGLTAG